MLPRHSSRIVFKEPGDFGTIRHRDMDSWGFDTADVGARRRLEKNHEAAAAVLWLPLTPVTRRTQGALYALPRSHVEDLLESGDRTDRAAAQRYEAGEGEWRALELGDAWVHHAKLKHASFPNDEDSTREAVQAMYAATPPFERLDTGSCLCGNSRERIAEVEAAAVRALEESGSASVLVTDLERRLRGYPAELIQQVVDASSRVELEQPQQEGVPLVARVRRRRAARGNGS